MNTAEALQIEVCPHCGASHVRTKDPHVIKEIVANYSNVEPRKLEQKTRKREVVYARHMAMYFIKLKTKLSLENIGWMFGNRDHTSVMHAIQRIKDLADVYPEVEGDIKELSFLINEA